MLEIVTMLTVLRSTEVVGRTVPVQTCEAVARAVETSQSDKSAIKYYLPDRPTTRDNQIIQVSCVPLLLHERTDTS